MPDPTPGAGPAITAEQLARIREVYPIDRKPCAWCNSRKSHHYDCPVPDIHMLLAALPSASAPAVTGYCHPHVVGGDIEHGADEVTALCGQVLSTWDKPVSRGIYTFHWSAGGCLECLEKARATLALSPAEIRNLDAILAAFGGPNG